MFVSSSASCVENWGQQEEGWSSGVCVGGWGVRPLLSSWTFNLFVPSDPRPLSAIRPHGVSWMPHVNPLRGWGFPCLGPKPLLCTKCRLHARYLIGSRGYNSEHRADAHLWRSRSGRLWGAAIDKKIMAMVTTAPLKPELSAQTVRTLVLRKHLTEEPGLDGKGVPGGESLLGKEHLS